MESQHRVTGHLCYLSDQQHHKGAVLVEFALIALVSYMLMALIITFGHALYVAQTLQQAADLLARELARVAAPVNRNFEEVIETAPANQQIYSSNFLVVDLDDLDQQGIELLDYVATWPVVNQQLLPLMIVDFADTDGDGTSDRRLLRYPGALLSTDRTPTGFNVGIPLVVSRSGSGVETIRWVSPVEEIDTEENNNQEGSNPDPFMLVNGGVVAVRFNYPFQSSVMSSFRGNPSGGHPDSRFNPTAGQPNAADDSDVIELNSPPENESGFGDVIDGVSATPETGIHGGRYGLGAQAALGSQQLTDGRPVRPYRRVISAQAIYRREVFAPQP